MHIQYFTERPYPDVPEDEIIMQGSFFGLSNRHYDPVKAGDLYHRYLDEKQYAEAQGFDSCMLNEHHGTPFCLGSVMNIEAAILARITNRMKIALMGNPLPVADPLRLAEELAEIDVISRGRLISGFVRGAGSEQLANNVNPAHNRERFYEAHDFIMQAWSKDGPWRHEGKHYHYRHVNPWAKPLQQPRPQVWIPGVVSPESGRWAATMRYPYLALATAPGATLEMKDIIADQAALEGYQAGTENYGYMQRVIVAESEAKAYELGKCYLFGGGHPNFARPEQMFPSGYNSREATQRLAKLSANPAASFMGSQYKGKPKTIAERRQRIYDTYDRRLESLDIIAGTPKTVIPKLRRTLEMLRPGILTIWHNEGSVSHEDTMTSLRLLGSEVLPAVREIGEKLELFGPDEVPVGSRPLPSSGVRESVTDYRSAS